LVQTNRIALLLIILAITIAIVLFILPKTPNLDQKLEGKTPLDFKVEQAIEMVQQTGMPMQGIALLREVLEEDPNHKEAIWQLGMFSVQSGQYDKAVERFESLIKIIGNEQDKTNIGPLFELSKAYIALGNYEKAIETMEKLENLVEDETLKKDISQRKEELINELKK
jgi:tetratricopeptide (TPR) repeat protein